MASFQAKFKVGPCSCPCCRPFEPTNQPCSASCRCSLILYLPGLPFPSTAALTGWAIFSSLVLLFLSSFLLAVPVIYDKYDKLRGLARALRVQRVAFICNGIGIFLSLLSAQVLSKSVPLSFLFSYSFITTISVFTQAGCKDASKDPSAEEAGDDFVAGLPGWCRTKRAGAMFFWLTLSASILYTKLATLIFPSRLACDSIPHIPGMAYRENHLSPRRSAILPSCSARQP